MRQNIVKFYLFKKVYQTQIRDIENKKQRLLISVWAELKQCRWRGNWSVATKLKACVHAKRKHFENHLKWTVKVLLKLLFYSLLTTVKNFEWYGNTVLFSSKNEHLSSAIFCRRYDEKHVGVVFGCKCIYLEPFSGLCSCSLTFVCN